MEQFRHILKLSRKSRKISPQKVARQSGLSIDDIERIENDPAQASLHKMVKYLLGIGFTHAEITEFAVTLSLCEGRSSTTDLPEEVDTATRDRYETPDEATDERTKIE